MIVWSIQPLDAVKQIEATGVFRCAAEKSFNLSKPDSLKKPYQWLAGRMREKIGEPPEGVDYPIWAWHIWDFEHRRPDPDSPAFLKRTGDKVFFTLDVPEDRLVLSDYETWQSVMMGSYAPDVKTEAELEALEAWLDRLEGDQLREAIEKSWENVFLTGRADGDGFARGRYVQATFWEIRREYVKDMLALSPNA